MVYLVIACRFGKVHIYRFSSTKSLWIFGAKDPVRKLLIRLTTNQLFEFFVIFTILVNCVFLALTNQPEEGEYVFTAIYTFEMVIKIIGRGFILDKHTYLRDPWNWLDFVVVILGYATLAPSMMMNFSGIRTFRVLRALRAISAIEGLKTMVNALLRSMKMLSEVLILTSFFLCVFALVGLQLFNGQLRSRCVLNNISIPINSTWKKQTFNSSNWYDGFTVCGNNTGSLKCPTNFTCLEHVGKNPNYGYTSFDNFGWSLLTSFQLITLDYWENVYFYILSSLGSWYIIYFVIVIFFGTFLVFNLMLAVVALSYEQVTHSSSDNDDSYTMMTDAGFEYPKSRCSMSKFIYDGPILDAMNLFSEEQRNSNLFVINAPKKSDSTKRTSIDYISDAELESKVELSRISESGTSISGSSFFSNSTPLPISTPVPNGNRITPSATPIIKVEGSTKLKSSCIARARRQLRLFTSFIQFEIFIILAIVVNTICLSMEYHGMSKDYARALHRTNDVLAGIFIVEFILKIIALGFKKYMLSRWNVFDFVVVIFSVLELVLEHTVTQHSGNIGLTVLRSLRLCRVLKIAKTWTIMRTLLTAMGKSLNALVYLTIILGLILYMFAVVGMQLFADYYKPSNFPNNQSPDWNFVDFGHSFMVIFRVLCGEWIELSYDCMYLAGLWTPLFFIAALIIGNFLILNLFLALLLGSMAQQSLEEEAKNRSKWRTKLRWVRATRRISAISNTASRKLSIVSRTLSALSTSSSVGGKSDDSQYFENTVAKNFTSKRGSLSRQSTLTRKSSIFRMEGKESLSGKKSASIEEDIHEEGNNHEIATKPTKCYTCTHKLRELSLKIIFSEYFMNSIIFIIAFSSIMLVFEDIYLPTRPKLKLAIEILDIIFCIIFLIEAILKLIALGFIRYIKNGWNVIDLIIVIASVLCLLPFSSADTLSFLRAFRTLRALRPLRAVSRWHGMKIVVNSFVRAIPSIANVALVCMMVWLIFSILGVQLFGGKFYKCLDGKGGRINASIVPNRTVCKAENLTWINSKINFDNVPNSFLALYQVATFEGMVEIMKNAIDATEVDKQPINQYNLYSYIYFIIFVVIGSFVLLNLFISVMIDHFYAIKKQQDDYGATKTFLSPIQKTWLLTVKRSLRKKPVKVVKRPTSKFLARIFDMLCSGKFEVAIIVLIAIDVLVMMAQHYNQPIEIDSLLIYTNVVITLLFFIEMLLKMIAFRRYFYLNVWNIVDMVIVFISIAVIVLYFSKIEFYITPTVFRLGRVIRLGRILRYFQRAIGLRRLFTVVINSSSSAFNMTVLLMILIYIYSVIGMINFGHVKKVGAFNDIVNFETFGNSLSTLIRVSTGAGWNEALDALIIEPPDCELYPVSNCPNVWGATIYFTTYVLISFLVIINMHIAIILENFNEVHLGESGITDEDIELYYVMWQLFDPSATQFIPFDQVSAFIATLGPPLAIPIPNKITIRNLAIPINVSQNVHCNNLLQALIRHYFVQIEGDEISTYEMSALIERKSKSGFPLLKREIVISTSTQRYQENKCAVVIQKIVREFIKRRRRERKIERLEMNKKRPAVIVDNSVVPSLMEGHVEAMRDEPCVFNGKLEIMREEPDLKPEISKEESNAINENKKLEKECEETVIQKEKFEIMNEESGDKKERFEDTSEEHFRDSFNSRSRLSQFLKNLFC